MRDVPEPAKFADRPRLRLGAQTFELLTETQNS